jgi:hypothetical protein
MEDRPGSRYLDKADLNGKWDPNDGLSCVVKGSRPFSHSPWASSSIHESFFCGLAGNHPIHPCYSYAGSKVHACPRSICPWPPDTFAMGPLYRDDQLAKGSRFDRVRPRFQKTQQRTSAEPGVSPDARTAVTGNNTADEFEEIQLYPEMKEEAVVERAEPRAKTKPRVPPGAWWVEEYWYAFLCVTTMAGLALLLQHYDNKAVPQLGAGIQIDTAIIALVTVIRVTLKGIVEPALSQGAWIWVSETSQSRCKHRARLSDFKLFDEASRGLWGSICLL